MCHVCTLLMMLWLKPPIRDLPNKAEMGLANIARAGAQDTGLKRKWCGLHITNIGKGVTTVAGTENIVFLRCTGKTRICFEHSSAVIMGFAVCIWLEIWLTWKIINPVQVSNVYVGYPMPHFFSFVT